MTLAAAGDGLAYLVTWREDFPDRARQTPSGDDAAAFILATPAYILWRIKSGEDPQLAPATGA